MGGYHVDWGPQHGCVGNPGWYMRTAHTHNHIMLCHNTNYSHIMLCHNSQYNISMYNNNQYYHNRYINPKHNNNSLKHNNNNPKHNNNSLKHNNNNPNHSNKGHKTIWLWTDKTVHNIYLQTGIWPDQLKSLRH